MKIRSIATRCRALSLLLFFLLSCGARDKASPQDDTVAERMDQPGSRTELAPEEQVSVFVRRIHQDRRGEFWFGTNGDGVGRLRGDSLVYYSIADGLGGTAVRAFAEERAGDLWIGTSGGVTRFDGTSFVTYTEEDGLVSNDVWSMVVDRAGIIWVGTWGGVCRFDPSDMCFESFPLPPAPSLDPLRGVTSLEIVHDIEPDRAGNMWFSVGNGGVHVFDGNALASYNEQDGLCGNTVNDILEDEQGNMWFATHYQGVCRFDGRSFTNVMEEAGLNGVEVWSLYEDAAGNIWFPVEGFGVYRHDGSNYTNFSIGEGLASTAIQCVFEDRAGRLWFGGWMGLFRFDGGNFVQVGKAGPWR